MGSFADVLLIVPDRSGRADAFAGGTGTVSLPGGGDITGRVRSWTTGSRMRVIAIEVPRARLGEIAAAPELTVAGDKRKVRVAQAGSAAVARALASCEEGLMESPPQAAAADAAVTPRPGDDIAAAAAQGNPAYWITSQDYPAGAVSEGYEGTTGARWVIEPDGRVRRCWITERSDHPALDAVVCQVLRQRARYRPATDERGAPVAQVHTRRVVWRIAGPDFPQASRIR